MAFAKTTRPRVHGIAPRPRLFRILDSHRAEPITWVSGPPGSGKTSLVASYLHARKLSGLWYQVDEADGDVAAIFHSAARQCGGPQAAHVRPPHRKGDRERSGEILSSYCGGIQPPGRGAGARGSPMPGKSHAARPGEPVLEHLHVAPPVMASLCARALDAGIEREYVLALLRALIALGGEQVREDLLADLLWPEADGDSAQQALSVTLHRLRRLLGDEDAVRGQAGRLSLDRRRCWTDVAALERVFSQAERLGTNGDSDHWVEAARWTDRSVQLYAGDFLSDEPESPWAVPFAERLRERLLHQVQKLARHWEQGSDWIQAADCYKRALDIHACSEECCRSLMQTYQRLGRRDEALAAYQRCSRHLTEQLGIHPSPQTQLLVEALKSGA